MKGRLSRLPHLPEEQQEAQGETASPGWAVSTRPGAWDSGQPHSVDKYCHLQLQAGARGRMAGDKQIRWALWLLTWGEPLQVSTGRRPCDPYLLVEQHLFHVCCPIAPRHHSVIRGHRQVAALSLRHRLPGAIEAEQPEVLTIQVLSPVCSALSWRQREGCISQGCPAESKPPFWGCDHPPASWNAHTWRRTNKAPQVIQTSNVSNTSAHDGVLLSNKKKPSSNTCYHADENMMQNKTSQSQKTTYHRIPFLWNAHNRQDRKWIGGCQLWGCGEGTANRGRAFLRVLWTFSNWILLATAPLCECAGDHWIRQSEWVDFTVCKLYLHKAVTLECVL